MTHLVGDLGGEGASPEGFEPCTSIFEAVVRIRENDGCDVSFEYIAKDFRRSRFRSSESSSGGILEFNG